jgi:RNA polymerase sigma factor (sigma-70 family)
MKNIDDHRIIQEIIKGSEYYLSLFNRKYHNYLMDIAINLYHAPRDDAGMYVNDTLYAAIRGIPRFRYDPGNPNVLRPWLRKILKNKIIDAQRKQTTESKFETYDESLLDREEDFSELTGPAKEVARQCIKAFEDRAIGINERKVIIQSVMETFELDDQAKLYCYFDGYSHREIALMFNTNEDASRQNVQRLKGIFFEQLALKLRIDKRTINERWKEYDKNNLKSGDAKGNA